MDITWYGHSCFRLTQRGMASIVTDPYDSKAVGYKALKLRADVVTISHEAPGHSYLTAVKGTQRVVNGPGEYEIGGVFITGVRMSAGKNDGNGHQNTLYVFDYDGVNVAHLGDLNRVPNQTEVEALGTVDVALVPVGGGKGLNAPKAAEVVSLLEPGIVIPMHYSTPDSKIKLASLRNFLKEMGLGKTEPEPSLTVRPTGVPGETRVVVLAYER
ncbi:MAG: MBL fold metallo-hydrolase [Anaerolineales bacterium]|nr:MBL fold metallo-hydrolase [Anaerolineales bacterium]